MYAWSTHKIDLANQINCAGNTLLTDSHEIICSVLQDREVKNRTLSSGTSRIGHIRVSTTVPAPRAKVLLLLLLPLSFIMYFNLLVIIFKIKDSFLKTPTSVESHITAQVEDCVDTLYRVLQERFSLFYFLIVSLTLSSGDGEFKR